MREKFNFCWLWSQSTIDKGPGEQESKSCRSSIMDPENLIMTRSIRIGDPENLFFEQIGLPCFVIFDK